MAIIRAKDITVMSKYHLMDINISLKAKGLLSQMLTLPDGWDISVNTLCDINKESPYAIRSALKELKDRGYLSITKVYPYKPQSGRIEYIYEIFEQPKRRV